MVFDQFFVSMYNYGEFDSFGVQEVPEGRKVSVRGSVTRSTYL